MKHLTTVFLALTFCAAISAQDRTSISGIVFLDGKPAADSLVELSSILNPNLKLSTRTDKDGLYRFDGIGPGTYRIWAEKRAPAVRPDLDGIALGGALAEVTLKPGEIKRIDLKLTPKVFSSAHIEPIRAYVTIAADSQQFEDQVSKSVNIIGAQEMRDRADFSLVESLRSIPGFRIQQLGGFGRTASIKSRGLRNQDTAVLIDGVRFRDPSSIAGDASAFLSDLTLTSVSRIEVLRGPGSSLYGTNSIGGTIDFQTPRPLEGWHGNISGAAGGLGLGRFRGNLSNATGDGRFGFTTGISRTAYTKGIDGDDRADNTNFQTRIEFRPFLNTNISARFFLSDAYVKLNNSPDTFGTMPSDASTVIDALPGINFVADANDPDNRQRSKFFNGQIVLSQYFQVGPNDTVSLQAFYADVTTGRRNTNGPRGFGFQPTAGNETYKFDGRVQTLSARAGWGRPTNNLTVGYEFERERFGNDGTFVTASNNFSFSAKQSSNTLYVQELLGIADGRLQISGAFRAQWFSTEKPVFSSNNFPSRFNSPATPPASYTGDGSASYYFRETRTKIRAHVGNGYRAPSLYERFGSYFFLGSFFGLGNPQLKPERSFAIDGGIDQELFGERMKLGATYFYNEVRDEVSYLPTDDLGGPSYYNADRHFSRGAELSAGLKPTDSTDIFASYSFVNSDLRASRRLTFLPPATIVSVDRRSFGVPANQFTLVVTQRFKDVWLNLDLLATSSYLAPIFSNSTFRTYTYRFEGNRRADLTAGYAFKLRKDKLNARLFATVENLFGNEYYENGFRTAGRNGRIGLSFGF